MSEHRLRASAALSMPRRLAVYAIGVGLWATGGLWLLFHFFVQTHFGSPHPLEPWWLTLHGGLAFASLWLFGLLWGVHVTQRWPAGHRRWSGGTMVCLLLTLSVTGYLLYYVGDEDLRNAVSLVHWIVGLAVPLLFFAHYFSRDHLGVRARKEARAKSDIHIVDLDRRRSSR